MTRRTCYVLAALAFWVALLCGCNAAGSLFTPGGEGGDKQPDAPIQTIIREAADATGNPLIQAAGAVAAALVGAFLGRKGAKKDTEATVVAAVAAKDKEEWSEEDIGSLIAALRARGWKVERA